MVVISIEVGLSVGAHRPCERTTHHVWSCASVSKRSELVRREVIHIAFPWARAGCLCGPTPLSDHLLLIFIVGTQHFSLGKWALQSAGATRGQIAPDTKIQGAPHFYRWHTTFLPWEVG
eukprot:2253238-Prymnesium_polylepis.1